MLELNYWVTYEDTLGERLQTRMELSPRQLRDLTAEPVNIKDMVSEHLTLRG
jgi:hypothetical protein